MTDYHYSISLRLSHPAWDPGEATTILKLSPRYMWRVGEARTTPKGDPLEGFYKTSYWTANLSKGNSKQVDLDGALANALAQLMPHKRFFVDFAASGGRAEFFIGWFFNEGNSGDVLDWKLLERLAQLRIDLAFDIYGTGDAA